MALTSVHSGVLLAPALQLIVWIWCIFHRCPHQGKPVIIITGKWNLDIRLYRKAFKWGTYQYITDDNQKLVMSWRREPLRTTVAPSHDVPFKSSSKDQITLVTNVHPLLTKMLFPNWIFIFKALSVISIWGFFVWLFFAHFKLFLAFVEYLNISWFQELLS